MTETQKNAPCVGIDLGTTNSLVSVFLNGKPELIPNSHGSVLTPSVIGVLESGEIIVGQAAKELRVTQPDACVSCFKRFMAQDRRFNLRGQEFSPIELSSLVLRSLKEDAANALGMPITEAVITVPAYFNDHARQATRLAGEMAGLTVRRMINEPTAAALVHGFHDRDDEKMITIIDLGGGTFDVTVMEVFESTLEIRSTAGESMLGGEDFTDRIVAHVLQTQNIALEVAEFQFPRRVARLRSECENAKRQLTRSDSASIRLPNEEGEFGGDPKTIHIDRTTYSSLCGPLLRRVSAPIARAMRDTDLAPEDIDDVILVGGATRMPVFQSFVENYFQKPAIARFNPDEIVALGASVQAALIERDAAVDDMIMTDVCPFTLGVEVSKELGGQRKDGYFSPILHRNSTIPISQEEMFYTVAANQPSVTVRVYQGDSRKTAENMLVGQLEVSPLPQGPAGSPLLIRFTYDISGVLEVEAYTPGGKKFRTVLTSHVESLSPQSVEDAKRRIASLKFYPREDQANLQLARFAERMLGELPSWQRQQLDQAIDFYESAMNRSNRDEFHHAKQMLLTCLSSLGISPEDDLA
ncbi:Hsp70 family protein [Rhodopirellula sp. MGV]|uniref:Hsp70 family protein n=1 Tax=Rhodopirellula sp. MGV TaxID=2023130 RepID=UPI000B97AC36|nr:molecular chaperone HscC [Rhodopirellula sp. MGV]OYP33157.1 molecular chaperone HscC [Rhodopirellula sp. MGV]PNY35114.1 molecular chaperone HscC [Rhodopirellula baltica]PNY37107.1 molecular chaperone HscC [Rhodopirellula baltica]